MPPLPAEDVPPGGMCTALVEHGAPPLPPASSSGDSDSEEEEEAQDAHLELPGPIDPERCTASGAGYSGGAAGEPARLVLLARDAAGRRVREGGAYVLVCVEAARAGPDAEPIAAEVVDNGDGSYTATYTVPAKGSYELSVEVNGEPVGNSPFPVFFSAPSKDGGGGAAAAAAAAPPAAGGAGAAAPPPTAEQAAAAAGAAAAAANAAAASMPMLPYPNLSTGMHISLVSPAPALPVAPPRLPLFFAFFFFAPSPSCLAALHTPYPQPQL